MPICRGQSKTRLSLGLALRHGPTVPVFQSPMIVQSSYMVKFKAINTGHDLILGQVTVSSTQPIPPVIAEAEMLLQQHWVKAILVTCRVLCGKVSELVPIATSVQLAIAHGKVSEGVQWCAVCVALYTLRTRQVRHQCPEVGSLT